MSRHAPKSADAHLRRAIEGAIHREQISDGLELRNGRLQLRLGGGLRMVNGRLEVEASSPLTVSSPLGIKTDDSFEVTDRGLSMKPDRAAATLLPELGRLGLSAVGLPAIAITTDNGDNINTASAGAVDWEGSNSHVLGIFQPDDKTFQHSTSSNPSRIRIGMAGRYVAVASLPYTGSGVRASVKSSLRLNGSTTLPGAGHMGYLRNTSGHVRASTLAFSMFSLTSSGYLEVMTEQDSSVTTACTLVADESLFGVLKIG